jgi:hypothetical protein
MATNTASSTGITARLATDGKNWKDWVKQLVNYAAADGAVDVLDGAARPDFDPTLDKYRITALQRTAVHPAGTSETTIQADLDRVGKLNKTIAPFNSEARQLLKEDKLALDQWVARDARLQNTILSSIANTLASQVRTCPTAHDMYKALKELNSNGDHANAALAWIAFIDLRAESQPSVRSYIGKFRETINDITVQGISLGWKKPSAVSTATSSERDVEDLLIIHFLHGLARVLPQWVEARNNDLRQGNTWSIDTLIASLEDHLRHQDVEPVKTFISVAKTAEEKRVLSRLKGRSNDTTSSAPSLPTRNGNNNNRPLKRTPQPVGHCDHCKREHPGPNDLCWKAHPELVPDDVKKKRAETAAQKAAAAAARTNVTIASNNDDDPYEAQSYVTVASFVSPDLLKKAITNHDYRKRYCYDTAANRHVFNDRSKFHTYTPNTNDHDVHGSTGSTSAKGVGTVRLEVVKADGTTEKIKLSNVLYCPDFATNVISQAPFKRAGVWYHSGKDKLYTASDKELAYLPEIDGIPNFLVVTNSSQAPAALSYASLHCYRSTADEPLSSRPASDWHHIMGHAGIEAIKDTAKVVHGMKLTTSTVTNCEPCGLSKSKRNISRIPQTPPSTALSKVHVDIVGPIATPGIDGEKYFMLITDGKSRRQWLFTSDSRAVLGSRLVIWCKAMKAKGLTIVIIHTDNAREFLKVENKLYFNGNGIEVITSPPYDATRNGIAERANGITEDRTRAALIAAKLPAKLWPYAAKFMARVHNLISNSKLPGKITPLECWNRSIGYPNPVPNVAKMHAFGHVGYAHIPSQKRVIGDKFAPRAKKGHLVGMAGENIYLMWIPETDEIITTASVRFDSYSLPSTPPTSPTIEPSQSLKVLPFKPLVNRLAGAAAPTAPQQEDDDDLDDHQLPRAGGGDGFDGFEDDDGAPTPPPQPTRGNNKAARRREINADLNPAHIVQGPRNRRPRVHFTSTTFDRCFAMALIKPTVGSKLSELPPEPRNYRQFKVHPRRDDLQLAMDDEYTALIANGTWRPATAEEIAKYEVIPGQWVWAYKGNAQGYHVKDKARMVACGNKQQESIWYREVYSYVVRTSTLRILLALVAYFDMECEQIDMITAYLNSFLSDDDVVLLRLPAGCAGFKNIVRLNRGMYGLRQSALLWYNDLKDSLKELGFEPNEADPCVFVNPLTKAIIVVYVDDLILITRNTASMNDLKEKLLRRYKARDLGPIGFYLGIRILRDRPNRSLSMTMDSYVDRLVEEYHLTDAPKADNPLPKTALNLTKRKDKADDNLTNQYQSLVAKLLYPTSIIRCDLS